MRYVNLALIAMSVGTQIGAPCLGIAQTRVRKFECHLALNVGALFPEDATSESIADDYFKGNFENKGVKKQIAKTLALRDKPVKIKTTLTEKTDGQRYSLELPGVTLPKKLVEIRHEVFDGEKNVKWFSFKDKTQDIGHVDRGTHESLTWSPVVRTLNGFVPTGPTCDKSGLGPNEVSFWEEPFSRVDETVNRVSSDPMRNFVVKYRDQAQTQIESVSMYWNMRTNTPFMVLQFDDAKVVGKELRYRNFLLTRYESGKLVSLERYQLISEGQEDKVIEAEPPVGKSFLDRRLGEDKHFTFVYDGKSIPTEAEILRALSERNRSVSQRQQDYGPAYRFALGALLVCLGFYLWRKSR